MIGSGVAVNFGNEFFNPQTPVEVPVRGFTNGQHLRMVIVPAHGGERFTVNLRSPQDIVLHFNPRFDERAVVCNSTFHGNWQHEERHGSFPFEHGKTYTLEFVSLNGEVHVKLNGHPFLEFAERHPGHDINTIEIAGDVHVHSVHVTH